MAQVINMTEQSLWQTAITKAQEQQLEQNSYKIAYFIANLIAKLGDEINKANSFALNSAERKTAFEVVHAYQDILDIAMKDLEVVRYEWG